MNCYLKKNYTSDIPYKDRKATTNHLTIHKWTKPVNNCGPLRDFECDVVIKQ